jgi:hypothetical protein
VGIPAGEVAIETETRIARMVELMLANEWKTGKTVKQLAAEWGITAQRARMLSAEASKIVRQELLANVSSLIVPSMTNIITTGPEGGPGDKMAAVQAARMLADIAGLTQHEKEAEPEHREQTLKVQFVAPERPKEKSE